MTEVESKVSQCFLSAFPGLNLASVRQASQETLKEWDSVAHVLLLVAISEEFGIELDEEAFESAFSYPQMIDFVRHRTGRD